MSPSSPIADVGAPETGYGTWVATPSPELAPFIDGYRGYRLPDVGPGFHRGVPSRYVTFIASIGQAIDVVDREDRSILRARYGTVVGSPSTEHAVIAYDGVQEGVAVAITPLGWHALFGMPVGALEGGDYEAGDLMGPLAAELRGRLHEATAWAERFAACDDVLARLFRGTGEPSGVAPEVREAWRMIVASGGTVAVHEVAAAVGWSRRHLAARFDAEFGLKPKEMGRVVRFERACRALVSRRFASIAEVAAVCGYADQPHLNREFVAMAGCPPGEWLTTELATDFPNVQDDDPSRSEDGRHE